VLAFAISLAAGMTVMLFGHLVGSGGRPFLLELIRLSPAVGEELAKASTLESAIYLFIWTVPCAMMAVGYPVIRDARETMERLGFVRPTWAQVGGAIGLAVVLVAVVLASEQVIGAVWRFTGWPRTDTKAFEVLMRPLFTVAGAFVVGITAGVGEELMMRGVLQPRLGIVLPNLLFTSLHAMQYSWDVLLIVFSLGLVLGVVRQRTNTTTAAIVHGTYDFILVMGAVLFPEHA